MSFAKSPYVRCTYLGTKNQTTGLILLMFRLDLLDDFPLGSCLSSDTSASKLDQSPPPPPPKGGGGGKKNDQKVGNTDGI